MERIGRGGEGGGRRGGEIGGRRGLGKARSGENKKGRWTGRGGRRAAEELEDL